MFRFLGKSLSKVASSKTRLGLGLALLALFGISLLLGHMFGDQLTGWSISFATTFLGILVSVMLVDWLYEKRRERIEEDISAEKLRHECLENLSWLYREEMDGLAPIKIEDECFRRLHSELCKDFLKSFHFQLSPDDYDTVTSFATKSLRLIPCLSTKWTVVAMEKDAFGRGSTMQGALHHICESVQSLRESESQQSRQDIYALLLESSRQSRKLNRLTAQKIVNLNMNLQDFRILTIFVLDRLRDRQFNQPLPPLNDLTPYAEVSASYSIEAERRRRVGRRISDVGLALELPVLSPQPKNPEARQ